MKILNGFVYLPLPVPADARLSIMCLWPHMDLHRYFDSEGVIMWPENKGTEWTRFISNSMYDNDGRRA